MTTFPSRNSCLWQINGGLQLQAACLLITFFMSCNAQTDAGSLQSAVTIHLHGLSKNSLLSSSATLDGCPTPFYCQRETDSSASCYAKLERGGKLHLSVSELDDSRCILSSTEKDLMVYTPTVELDLDLKPAPDVTCPIKIQKQGGGSARIFTDSKELDCGSTCTFAFKKGQKLLLRSAHASDYNLVWKEGCTQSDAMGCQVSIDGAKQVIVSLSSVSEGKAPDPEQVK